MTKRWAVCQRSASDVIEPEPISAMRHSPTGWHIGPEAIHEPSNDEFGGFRAPDAELCIENGDAIAIMGNEPRRRLGTALRPVAASRCHRRFEVSRQGVCISEFLAVA